MSVHPAFTVAFVPGVTPDKWVRRWADRHPDRPLRVRQVEVPEQLDVVRDGHASMAFVRDLSRPDDLHLIPLYEEVPVAVVHHEHPAAAFDEIDLDDLVDEPLFLDPDIPAWRDLAPDLTGGSRPTLPPMTLRQAVETVGAGTGVVVTVLSVARLHQRKDVVAVPLLGLPGSAVGLAWRRADDDDRLETFVGIVRGRTERSSRGEGAAAAPEQPPAKPEPRRSSARTSSPARTGRSGRSGRSRRR
ncbi:LysR substrate-binding domain-containing protein [Nocardioides mesophilus]|uniref:LysR family transcriptional regulator n=1 Tax=Nocardioides mesophilus TaxID=433659 RepID=A0A7G9RB56_9ACTN|nr:LysR substrate-binding domain-containing protein [Nocardioides mesophilus]QNN52831.1 LysR family transcriptional regulator [Nocardioides mesophilus]